jgi:hypothetical protein
MSKVNATYSIFKKGKIDLASASTGAHNLFILIVLEFRVHISWVKSTCGNKNKSIKRLGILLFV